MFKNLTNLSMKRNWKEAIIFYVAYLILVLLIAFIVGIIIGIINPYNVLEVSEKAGIIIGTIYSILLYFIIYYKKGMSSFLYIILGLVTGIVSLFLNEIFALMIVAFLTTREDKSGSGINVGEEELN